jgi:predicted DNA-binding protein
MDSHEIQRAAKPRGHRESRTKVVMKQLNVRMDDTIIHKLKKFSEKTGKSQSYLVQEAISSYLWNMKDRYG